MKDNQLQIVTYGQAKRLKELGFDWECSNYYCRINKTLHKFNNQIEMNSNNFPSNISAPIVALALKWCRDVKNIDFHISRCILETENLWDNSIHYGKEFIFYINNNLCNYLPFETCDLAESALLDEILNILEQEK